VIPDPVNKRLMAENVKFFKDTIKVHGLVPGVSGEAWARFPKKHGGPLSLLSSKHRAMGFYEADKESPSLAPVKETRQRGLTGVAEYDPLMPDTCAEWLCTYSNKWHHNGNTNFLQFLEKALQIEAMFLLENTLPTDSPEYEPLYKKWVKQYHGDWFPHWDPFLRCKSCAHCLTRWATTTTTTTATTTTTTTRWGVWSEFKQWAESTVRFLQLSSDVQQTVAGALNIRPPNLTSDTCQSSFYLLCIKHIYLISISLSLSLCLFLCHALKAHVPFGGR
jgi:hypothetical protein